MFVNPNIFISDEITYQKLSGDGDDNGASGRVTGLGVNGADAMGDLLEWQRL